MPFVDLKDKWQFWGLLLTMKTTLSDVELTTKQHSSPLVQYWYKTSHVSCKVSPDSTLSQLHPMQKSPSECSTLSMPPPLLTPLFSPPHQARATHFHFAGLPKHFLIPTLTPLASRLNQSLSCTSKHFPSDNSAMQLLWHRRITPVKASNPSFITHISTVNCQQFSSRHLICHHHCFSCVGTHFFFALSSCLVFLHENCLWFYTWVTSPKRRSLSSHYVFYSIELNGWWARISRYSNLVPHFPRVYPAILEANQRAVKPRTSSAGWREKKTFCRWLRKPKLAIRYGLPKYEIWSCRFGLPKYLDKIQVPFRSPYHLRIQVSEFWLQYLDT